MAAAQKARRSRSSVLAASGRRACGPQGPQPADGRSRENRRVQEPEVHPARSLKAGLNAKRRSARPLDTASGEAGSLRLKLRRPRSNADSASVDAPPPQEITVLNRRLFLVCSGASFLGGCVTPQEPASLGDRLLVPATREPFQIAAVDLNEILRSTTARSWRTRPANARARSSSIRMRASCTSSCATAGARYGVGVGRQGFTWSGTATVARKSAAALDSAARDGGPATGWRDGGRGHARPSRQPSARGPYTCIRTTATRSTASTAPPRSGPSAGPCPPAASGFSTPT